MPTDLRKQIERTVKDGQKTVVSAIRQLETRVNRNARQVDVDKVLKRLEGLTKQVQELARGAASRGAARATTTRRRAASTTRRARKTVKKAAPAKRRAPARKAAAAKPAARKPAARKASPRRSPARRATAASPQVRSVPEAPAPGPIPESVDTGSGF